MPVHGGQRTLIDLWVISQEVLRSAELRQPPRSFSRLRVQTGVQRNVRAVTAVMWLAFGPEKAHRPPTDTSENGLCPAARCCRSSRETAESLVLRRCPLSRTRPTVSESVRGPADSGGFTEGRRIPCLGVFVRESTCALHGAEPVIGLGRAEVAGGAAMVDAHPADGVAARDAGARQEFDGVDSDRLGDVLERRLTDVVDVHAKLSRGQSDRSGAQYLARSGVAARRAVRLTGSGQISGRTHWSAPRDRHRAGLGRG